jgi:putative flavoprotein involved in K+ transport
MGYFLAKQGLDFAIVDSAPMIGHGWRTRWSSLRLSTPARYSSLPLPGDRNRQPGKDEVAEYLAARIAAHHGPGSVPVTWRARRCCRVEVRARET